MSDFKIRRRARLKTKPARQLRDRLAEVFGHDALWQESAAIETAEAGGHPVILVDGVIHGIGTVDEPFLSVRGLLAYRPKARAATVDMGAVRFVHNGADIMGPGITEADPELEEGQWVWIRDEKNGQPLAVGRCLVAGNAMAKRPGKAVQNIHHIGDKLWELDG